jgi:alpha-L-fucosidase
VSQLLATYDETVGRGAQLMLGLAPDRRGLLPESDTARLKEFGEALRTSYAHNLALVHEPASAEVSAALDGNPNTFWSAPAGSHHSTLEVAFSKPITFDRAVTMEWLNDGQRVQKYSIDAWNGTGWKAVAAGEAIGHKKIDVFPAVSATRVRLNILSSTDAAAIREFQLYNTAKTAESK